MYHIFNNPFRFSTCNTTSFVVAVLYTISTTMVRGKSTARPKFTGFLHNNQDSVGDVMLGNQGKLEHTHTWTRGKRSFSGRSFRT